MSNTLTRRRTTRIGTGVDGANGRPLAVEWPDFTCADQRASLAVTSAHSGRPGHMVSQARYYTVKEAAEYLRFSPITIYRNAYSGRLRGKRYGRSWRFTREHLDSLLIDHQPLR